MVTPLPATRITTTALACEDGVGDGDNVDDVAIDGVSLLNPVYDCLVYILWESQTPASLTSRRLRGLLQPESCYSRVGVYVGCCNRRPGLLCKCRRSCLSIRCVNRSRFQIAISSSSQGHLSNLPHIGHQSSQHSVQFAPLRQSHAAPCSPSDASKVHLSPYNIGQNPCA